MNGTINFKKAQRFIDDEGAIEDNKDIKRERRDDNPKRKQNETKEQHELRLLYNQEMKKTSLAHKGRPSYKSTSQNEVCKEIRQHPEEGEDEYDLNDDFVDTREEDEITEHSSDEDSIVITPTRKRNRPSIVSSDDEDEIAVTPDVANTYEDDDESTSSSSDDVPPTPPPTKRTPTKKQKKTLIPELGETYFKGQSKYTVHYAGSLLGIISNESKLQVQPDWDALTRDHCWTLVAKDKTTNADIFELFAFTEDGRSHKIAHEKIKRMEVKLMETDRNTNDEIFKYKNMKPVKNGLIRMLTHPSYYEWLLKMNKTQQKLSNTSRSNSAVKSVLAKTKVAPLQVAVDPHYSYVDTVLQTIVRFGIDNDIDLMADLNQVDPILFKYAAFIHGNKEQWKQVYELLQKVGENGITDVVTAINDKFTNGLDLMMCFALLNGTAFTIANKNNQVTQLIESKTAMV
jgi:hypothetical protein